MPALSALAAAAGQPTDFRFRGAGTNVTPLTFPDLASHIKKASESMSENRQYEDHVVLDPALAHSCTFPGAIQGRLLHSNPSSELYRQEIRSPTCGTHDAEESVLETDLFSLRKATD